MITTAGHRNGHVWSADERKEIDRLLGDQRAAAQAHDRYRQAIGSRREISPIRASSS